MMTNINGIELIKALLRRGYKGVKVELTDSKGTIRGFITVNNKMWAISDAENFEDILVGVDSLESLMQNLADKGWTLFSVTEKIMAKTEDDVECQCKNTVDTDGFYPCDEKGNEVEPKGDYGDLAICAKCGIIFDNRTFDPAAKSYNIVGIGEFEPLMKFELGNGVGYLKGYFEGEECLIQNTKEQISAFIMDSSREREVVITDMLDRSIIKTMGGFIDKCYDQGFLPELLEVLVPQQLGEVEPIEFVPIQQKD